MARACRGCRNRHVFRSQLRWRRIKCTDEGCAAEDLEQELGDRVRASPYFAEGVGRIPREEAAEIWLRRSILQVC